MTSQQKLDIKFKIIQEFKGLHFTLIEMYSIFDELKSDLSRIAIEQELKKLKIRRK